MLEVFRMRDADIPAVAELEKACFSTPWSEKSLAESLLNPAYHMIVAKDNDELFGYIGTYITADELNIANVAVDPKHRREGVGQFLVEMAIQMAQARRLSTIYLEVRESNTAAIALYQKLGFHRFGRRKNFYENPVEDGLIMRFYLDELNEDMMF